MARGLTSPRIQYRWCTVLIRITLALVIGAAVFAFQQNVRTGFLVLLVGCSVLIVQLLLRDYLARRLEQRRKPYRIKYESGEDAAAPQELEPAEEG